jgi:hypothetical protein
MRQRLNHRRPRHTEPYARPQRRESASAKIEASVSAAIPLASACRYLDTDFTGAMYFQPDAAALDLAFLYGGLTRS